MSEDNNLNNLSNVSEPRKKRARIVRNKGEVTTADDLARMELEEKYKDQIEREELLRSIGRHTNKVSMSDLVKSAVQQKEQKRQEEEKAKILEPEEVKKNIKESPYSKDREDCFASILRSIDMLKEIVSEYKNNQDSSNMSKLSMIEDRIKGQIVSLSKLFSNNEFDIELLSSIKKAYDSYAENNTNDSLKSLNAVINRGFKREEVKKIYKISGDIINTNSSEAKKELENFIEGKNDREKSYYISEVVSHYKKNRTEKRFKAMNVFLNTCEREVERFSYVETPYDQRKAARAVFDGSFNIPKDTVSEDRDYDRKEFSPYSDSYKKFLGDRKAGRGRATEKNDKDVYNLSESTGWKTLVEAGIDIREDKVKEAFALLGLPKGLVKNLNSTDIAKILYDANKLKENPKHDITSFPANGANLAFRDVDDKSEAGVRNAFLKRCFSDEEIKRTILSDLERKGVSEDYIKLFIKSIMDKDNPTANPEPIDENGNKIPGPIPFITIHHKTPIQDAAKLGDFSKINDFSNLLIVVDMPGEENHELRHITDEPLCINKNQISEDDAELLPAWQGANDLVAERMVDLADRRNDGKSLAYSSGFDKASNITVNLMDGDKGVQSIGRVISQNMER